MDGVFESEEEKDDRRLSQLALEASSNGIVITDATEKDNPVVDPDPYKTLVARKVLEITQGLDVETLVEGVEPAEEFAWAHENGATFAQGYLTAKPASPPCKTLSTGLPRLGG